MPLTLAPRSLLGGSGRVERWVTSAAAWCGGISPGSGREIVPTGWLVAPSGQLKEDPQGPDRRTWCNDNSFAERAVLPAVATTLALRTILGTRVVAASVSTDSAGVARLTFQGRTGGRGLGRHLRKWTAPSVLITMDCGWRFVSSGDAAMSKPSLLERL